MGSTNYCGHVAANARSISWAPDRHSCTIAVLPLTGYHPCSIDAYCWKCCGRAEGGRPVGTPDLPGQQGGRQGTKGDFCCGGACAHRGTGRCWPGGTPHGSQVLSVASIRDNPGAARSMLDSFLNNYGLMLCRSRAVHSHFDRDARGCHLIFLHHLQREGRCEDSTADC